MGLKRLAYLATYTKAKDEERGSLINEAGALIETAAAARQRGDTETRQRALAAADRLLEKTKPVEG
ncbi:hypothetical protein U9R90_05235 [Streptomyces sp. E11-3]|uniref:hypothetical protein n=1 Tax=Streptomyces sp. E11-3 TaxID=3110112 RepID=UPI00397F74F5